MKFTNRLESEVRSYCRTWPTTFTKAKGSRLYDDKGREYLDFFSGAGSLNYGHGHPRLKTALLEYLQSDAIVHGLDMSTVAKERFLERFEEVILRPRGLDYKVQFPGPAGTTAVEAALKLARKVTGRERVVGFTNAFHGMTLGSLAITGSSPKRGGAGILLSSGVNMPFDGYLGEGVDTIDYLEALLDDDGSGLDLPAAIIVETVQGEGGINVASREWLRHLSALARQHGILLILDDIQVGCGRTGPFFSFEAAGIVPDIVCLSKALSGYGMPFAVTLLRSELDVWDPGEHNGTFRGFNPAFVTATEALTAFWEDDTLTKDVKKKGAWVSAVLDSLATAYPELGATERGWGLIRGLACEDPAMVEKIVRAAFELGLIIETSGSDSEVLKLLPALVIDDDDLAQGLGLLDEAIASSLDVPRRLATEAVAEAMS
ncbi:MAG: diaminobutyrate--2-oxoglutarate transaminase [Actinobacteria bacterium]|nr:diaminobutyrate--2-oxoglutarate transaminase [Actinomycetota bacterium]MBW3644646.1 diaminobutyrate--2-oxoglutarate transaminase [Actinomycetota bacterium]